MCSLVTGSSEGELEQVKGLGERGDPPLGRLSNRPRKADAAGGPPAGYPHRAEKMFKSQAMQMSITII